MIAHIWKSFSNCIVVGMKLVLNSEFPLVIRSGRCQSWHVCMYLDSARAREALKCNTYVTVWYDVRDWVVKLRMKIPVPTIHLHWHILCNKKGNIASAPSGPILEGPAPFIQRRFEHILSLPSLLYLPVTFRDDEHTMAIQREPGQKGINWSNIAVGERVYNVIPFYEIC